MNLWKARLLALLSVIIGPVVRASYRNIPAFKWWVDRMLAPTSEQQEALALQCEGIEEAERFCAWADPVAEAILAHAENSPPRGMRIIN